MNQESQIDADVNLYFIVPCKYKSEDDCSEDMWHAYNKCCEHDLQPIWIDEKKCNKMKPAKNDVFVMEEFEGDTFYKLKTFKCPIVGPRCLLLCFINGEPIPEGTSPVYTTAMRGLCICASGFSLEEKEHIQKLVEYMGGIFTKQLRSRVTHLITSSVMSAKYETAIDMKIPIVTKEWVEAVWEINMKDFVTANDSMFDKYKASVFLNLVVTSTNLPKHQKEEIKRLINDNGGTFMGPLDGAKVKVVLAPTNSPISEKLKYAKQANIACLTPDWVYESIKVGYALPFKDYLITSIKVCSTPERSNVHESLDCSAISSIPCDLQQGNCVDESLATTISNVSTMDQLPNSISSLVLDRLTFSEAKSAGPFLDGCNIYLAGFVPNQRDKINKILNVGSATRLDDISDALTHVIVGDENRAASELKLMKSKGLCPYILTLEWLEQSIKLKRPAPEENFIFEEKSNGMQKVSEPPSPLSKKNLQMLQKPRKVPIPHFDVDRKLSMIEKEKEKESSELLQQYLQNTVVATNDKTVQEFLKPHTPTMDENTDKTLVVDYKKEEKHVKESLTSTTAQSKYLASNSTTSINQMSTLNDRLFEGLTFVVTGFTDEDSYVAETIVAMGGQVVSSTFAGVPDYGVVPKCGTPLKHTVNEIVTDLFIEDCVNQEQIIEIMYYHKPLSIKKHSNPLSGCVITMSMYTGVERTYLATLATELGAMCQDIFVRKTNIEKNIYGSTHLICPTPEGNKYNAAVKWKLPAVTADWLKSCAAQSKRVDETPFLVGETVAPEKPSQTCDMDISLSKTNSNQMGPPNDSVTRNIITPKRHLPHLQSQDGSSGDTPLINKRLSLLMNKTLQSPFHVSTPESPYGQVFKPNPSPETRKGWVKWVDNFPDLRVEEPPLKKRALSTPLSELKKQLWQKLKNQDHDSEDDKSETLPTVGNKSSTETTETPVTTKDNCKVSVTTPINRKLEFLDENSPLQNNEINMQIAQLDQVLQRTSSTPENRYSLSGEKANTYHTEPSDPIQKFMTKDSQPIDAIVWEDPSHAKRLTMHEEQNENISENEHNIDHAEEESLEEPEPPKKPKFMLSGIKDRTAYEQVIKNLGGDVSSDANFDITATHLLCIRPVRNEKMLGSIASGKWILHCMYLRDSEHEETFLDEEKYEWGNPKSKGIIPDPVGEIEEAIAAAAYRWRLKLLKEPNGPFHNMVALLLTPKEKYDQFKRLIETGGGKVVQARPPYDTSPTGKKITHCFVNAKQCNQPIDWAMLASKGILCFLPHYLSDYLTTQTPLNPRECVIPEFKKYLALLPK